MSTKPFPRRTHAQETGAKGLTIVEGIVRNHLNWEFRRTPQESDFGIDGYIDIISNEGYVTGKSIAVQIKTGGSYFRQESDTEWQYSGALKHVNYYINHPCKVVLIIVNENDSQAWWGQFSAYETDRSGESWTIPIPKKNRLSADTKLKLEQIPGPARNYLPHLEEVWLLRERIKTNDILVIQISQLEVETQNTRPFERVLERLSSSPSALIDAQGKVDFVFSGYDNDKREVFEIPEIISWTKQMISTTPSLPYLISLKNEAHGIKTIINIIAGATVSHKNDNTTYIRYTKPKNLSLFINDQFQKLNTITDTHDLLENTNKSISLRLIDLIKHNPFPQHPKRSTTTHTQNP